MIEVNVQKLQYPYCQKILPLVYDDSLSYYEALCSFVSKMNEVIETINNITVDILNDAKKYTDEAIAEQQAIVNEKIAEVTQLVIDTTDTFNMLLNDLQQQYDTFTNLIDSQIQLFDSRIDSFAEEIANDIIGVNARTDLAIQQNNEYIFDIIENSLTTELKVVNFFTGEKISIQDMFNYLANLHVDDGLTYDEFALVGKDYNYLASLNITYTDLVMHGKSLYV